MLLLMANKPNALKIHKNQEQLQDVGTCKNCARQGNCPYSDGTCSRSYYHKIYSDKKKISVDKFILK